MLDAAAQRGALNIWPAVSLPWFCLLLAGLGACAPRSEPAASAHDALAQRPESFVARVARLRQLSERRATPVVFDDDVAFERVANQKAEREAIQPTAMDVPAVQLSLGLLFAAEGAAPARSFGSLHRSQMVAFYDEFSHRVHISQRARADEDLPFVVAHELGHSLQFQHFSIPEIANVTDEDARLARLSLLEGDAMLVMTALAAEENHVPLSRVLVRLAQGALEANLRGYKAALEQSPELKSAAPFQRERLVFPYQAGASFVAQVHRAGGFALVNRLYEVPPATTEHILHPEKYLQGEPAVPVRAPKPPAGWALVRSGHVGELLVRAMLDVCNQRPVAYVAASGWGGDAFTVVRRGEQGGLLFVSTWDTAQDADEFEGAVRATAACWDRAPAATRAIFRGVTRVWREGQTVALARGFPAKQARLLLAGSGELVGARALASPPFGPVVIPPVRSAAVVPAPFVRGDRVIAPRLGLSIPLRPGLKLKIEDDDVSFSASGAGFASLIFAISDLAYSPASVRYSFDTFEQALRKPLARDQSVTVAVKAGRVQTPLGKALERVWQIDETPIQGRLTLVPVCRGTGMLVIGRGYAGEEMRRLLDEVVAGVIALEAGSPICAELDP